MHNSSQSLFQKQPFGLGWRTHFNFCVAELPQPYIDQELPVLRKSKQFTVFDFIKKQENSDIVSDSDTPKSILLTQFHVIFAYAMNVTVVSRVS